MALGKSQDEALAGTTQGVLKEIRMQYDGPLGLKEMGNSSLLGLRTLPPKKKVTIMIVGNHSAGKSSFINWYVGEEIQKTGVAIETRGFTFVTSGKKRETLTGDATLRFYDFLEGFTKFEGIVPNLFTEISTSRERSFQAVDFIDTPGLVDGDMLYPFPVEDAILWLAEHVDMIMVFFDPIGQATCKRTLNVVERLNQSDHLEKIHYFMSKADAVEKEHDRQRVLIQITQNLATRIRNSHAFNLPTFFLPRNGHQPNIPNAIDEVCKEIDKAVSMTVQKSLRLLSEDCERVKQRTTEVETNDVTQKRKNRDNTIKGIMLMAVTQACAVLQLLCVAAYILPPICETYHESRFCQLAATRAIHFASPLITKNFKFVSTTLLCGFISALLLTKLIWQTKPVLTKRDKRKLVDYRQRIDDILEEREGLYSRYFDTLAGMER